MKSASCQWPLAREAIGLWNVLLLLSLLLSKCSVILGAFLDITVKAFSAQWDLIHANSHCGGEGCWLTKACGKWDSWRSPAGPPALCQGSLPPGQGHLHLAQNHSRAAATGGPLLEQFKFVIGLLPSSELQTKAIPGATLLLAQRSLCEGQPWAVEWQGRARGWELLQPCDFHLCLWLNTLPDHKGQLFVSKVYRRWSLDIMQIWWVWALWSNLSSWVMATHKLPNLLNSFPQKGSVFQVFLRQLCL